MAYQDFVILDHILYVLYAHFLSTLQLIRAVKSDNTVQEILENRTAFRGEIDFRVELDAIY